MEQADAVVERFYIGVLNIPPNHVGMDEGRQHIWPDKHQGVRLEGLDDQRRRFL